VKYLQYTLTMKKLIIVPIFVSLLFLLYAVSRSPLPELPDPPLKDLAIKHGVEVGNFAIRNRIKEPEYSHILTTDYTLALADNTPNWYFTDGGLRPSRDTYYFDHMDEVVGYAENNGMNIQAHHYLWGEKKWLPQWLKNENYTEDELYQIIDDHIMTVGARYSGKIKEWTVVNEAFSRGQNIYGLHDWWADATGSKEYIDRAFITARKADPKSKLILNDFGNESFGAISDEMFEYIKDARTRGIPIDGLGMQMHIDGTNPPKKADVIKNMQRFREVGIEVYVTEFDVNMNDVKANAKEKNQKEADIYYDMARACIESKACISFALLGITDKETWYNYMGLSDPRPLPFDKNYKPKPAYFALRRAFEEE
jgi:endo-1,4-beta-xylanase